MSLRVPLLGRELMVVCDHHLAATSALDIHRGGGNLVDAALAAAAVQCVTLPMACTLGGDAFMLVHNGETRKTLSLSASGAAPLQVRLEDYVNGMPQRGAGSVTSPGVVAGWAALHERFGRLPFKRLFDSAIELAEEGFAASEGLANATATAQSLLAADQGSAQIFLRQGRPLAVGELFRQPALARSLRRLAGHGPVAGFYEDEAAASIVRTVRAYGPKMELDDLSMVRPAWSEPLSVGYRGRVVHACPPNSFGLFMALQLGLRDRILGNCAIPRADLAEREIAIAKHAFALAERIVADHPDADERARDLLTGPALNKLADDFQQGGLPGPIGRDAGGTAIVLAADAAGNGVCIVQSIFLPFGSCVTDPSSGILLNNRMLGFLPPSDHPNALAPGRKPAHTLNPCIVTSDEGELLALLGTPGGPGQTLTLSQVLSGRYAEGLSLAEAVERPRWSTDLNGNTLFEPSFPAEVISQLRDRGVQARVTTGSEPFFGTAQMVERTNGTLAGAADARREAYVLAL